MANKETFENQTILGYTTAFGDCKTYQNKSPAYISVDNFDVDKCSTACNNDDSCSGFSFDNSNNKCTIFNPSIGRTVDSTTDSANYPVLKGIVSETSNNMCYIKTNQVPDGYELLPGGMCTVNNSTYTSRNYSSTTYKDCYTACKLDKQCGGFSYSNNGFCLTHSPTFKQNEQLRSSITNLGFSWSWIPTDNDTQAVGDNPEISTSFRNLGTLDGPINAVWPASYWNCYKKTTTEKNRTVVNNTSNYRTLVGTCRAINDKYPVYTNNYFGFQFKPEGYTSPVPNVPGQTEELCKNTCNNDPLCTGYSWLQDTAIPTEDDIWYNGKIYNRCQLYNYTFSNKAGTIDAATAIPWDYSESRYSPVYTANNDASWKCNIKIRDRLPNYKPSLIGICKTINNKDIPYTSGKTTYNNCVNLCEKDVNCAGYSYGNDGTCYIHNPTIAANTYVSSSSTMDPSGTPLSTSNKNNMYECFIKTVGKCTNIISVNNDFQLPLLDLMNISDYKYTIDNWISGKIELSNVTSMITTSDKTGVINLYGSQYAFSDPKTYIEQIIPNKIFESGQYVFSITGYNNSNSVLVNSLISILSVDETETETILISSTLNNINVPTFKLSTTLTGDNSAAWIGKQIKIRITNTGPIRLYYLKAELIHYKDCLINYQAPTTTRPVTTRPPTTTTIATPTTSTIPLTTTSVVDALTAAAVVTEPTIVTTIVPTTTVTVPAVTTTVDVTFPSQNTSTLVNTNMLDSKTVQIVLSNNIETSKYFDVIDKIKNTIDPNSLYLLSDSYNNTNNVYTITVKNIGPFNNSIEHFEVYSKGLTVKVIYQDNIEKLDPSSVSNLMNISENSIRTIIQPTTTAVNKALPVMTFPTNIIMTPTTTTTTSSTSSTTFNKKTIGIIIGVAIGVIVLIIIGVVVYKKKKSPTRPRRPRPPVTGTILGPGNPGKPRP